MEGEVKDCEYSVMQSESEEGERDDESGGLSSEMSAIADSAVKL